MIVGVLTIDVALFEARTLKDKRRIISSLKQRLRNRFNVSVAEVAYTETPKRSQIAVVTVANSSRLVHEVLDKVVDQTRGVGGLSLLDYQRTMH